MRAIANLNQLAIIVFSAWAGVLGQSANAAPRDVQFKSVDFDTSVIEVHNFGDSVQPFVNWQFCTHDDNQTRRYSTSGLLNSVSLDAGESLFIHFNNDAPGGATDALNISSLGSFATPLDRGPYSIGLYLNGAFGSPNSLVDHLQWSIDGVDNSTADERSLVAQMAGLWTSESEWISTSATTRRLELILDGSGDPPAEAHGATSYAVVEPSPADIDGDGDVDGDDLASWTAGFGAGNGGDIDGDGDTDGADFLRWQRDFTGSLSNLSAVPEPTTALLTIVAALVISSGPRRRI